MHSVVLVSAVRQSDSVVHVHLSIFKGFPGGTSGKEDVRDEGSIPGSGRSPGGGHGNPLQYSCLENPLDRGAWRAIIVHRVARSRIRLTCLSTAQHSF